MHFCKIIKQGKGICLVIKGLLVIIFGNTINRRLRVFADCQASFNYYGFCDHSFKFNIECR